MTFFSLLKYSNKGTCLSALGRVTFVQRLPFSRSAEDCCTKIRPAMSNSFKPLSVGFCPSLEDVPADDTGSDREENEDKREDKREQERKAMPAPAVRPADMLRAKLKARESNEDM